MPTTGMSQKNLLVLIFSAISISGLIAVFFTPDLLYLLEFSGKTLSKSETAMRCFIGLWIVFCYFFLLAKSDVLDWLLQERWRVWVGGLFAIGVLTTFCFDNKGFYQESSWIRNWTASVLLIAGILGIRGAFQSSHGVKRLLAGFLGLLFIFAAADERFEIHENVTWQIENYYEIKYGEDSTFSYGEANDVPTLSYALIGIFVLVLARIAQTGMGQKVLDRTLKAGSAWLLKHHESLARNLVRGLLGLLAFAGVTALLMGIFIDAEFARKYISVKHQINDHSKLVIRDFQLVCVILGPVLLALFAGLWAYRMRVSNFISTSLLVGIDSSSNNLNPSPDNVDLYGQALSLFSCATIAFFIAMLLDTYDKKFEDLINLIKQSGFLGLQSGLGDIWVSFVRPAILANILEEALEYLAALFFLAMNGVLFANLTFQKPFSLKWPSALLVRWNTCALALFLVAGLALFFIFPQSPEASLINRTWEK